MRKINNIGKKKLANIDLLEIATKIRKEYQLKVTGFEETEDGYKFIGEYGYYIGDITYDEKSNIYSPFFFYEGIDRVIDKRKQSEQNTKKRKFALKRRAICGGAIAIAIASIATLIGLGVIKNKKVQKELVKQESELENDNLTNSVMLDNRQIEKNVGLEVEDLILLEWLNNVVGELRKNLTEEYNGIIEICENYLQQTFYSYYQYLDVIDSMLPQEIMINEQNRTHSEFKNNILELNEYLKGVGLEKYTFPNSPLNSAIITNKSGEKIENPGNIKGEVKNEKGSIITYDDKDQYKIYVPAKNLESNFFDLDNVPENAIIYKDSIYIELSQITKKKLLFH